MYQGYNQGGYQGQGGMYQGQGGMYQGGQGYNQGGNQGVAPNFFNPNENYVILNARNKGMALDVLDKSQNKLLLRQKHGQENQQFRIANQNGKFMILNFLGGTVEIPQGSTQNGCQVQVNQPNNAVNQFWNIQHVQGANDAFYIKSFCDKSLDLYQGSTQEGTPIIQWDFHGRDNQIWYIVPKHQMHNYQGGHGGYGQQTHHQQQGFNQGYQQQGYNQGYQQQQGYNHQNLFDSYQHYVVTSAINPSMAMDVSQGEDYNQLILWDVHGQQNQRFKFIQCNNGNYFIQTHNGGRVEVPNNSTDNGVQITCRQANNTPNEMWQITRAHGQEGAYHIKSFCGKSLDLYEGSTMQNTPIIQWDFHGNDNQVWYIKS